MQLKHTKRTAFPLGKLSVFFLLAAAVLFAGTWCLRHGQAVDALNGVTVYRNGFPLFSHGRTFAPNGYNIGLKYQCVEFVKRYYFEKYGHQMPDAYGHASSFFNPSVPHGALNKQRGLIQYQNGKNIPPAEGDILVFAPAWYNPYGHVAIVAKTEADKVEYIQQNTLRARASRPLAYKNGGWTVHHKRLLGWLRRPEAVKYD